MFTEVKTHSQFRNKRLGLRSHGRRSERIDNNEILQSERSSIWDRESSCSDGGGNNCRRIESEVGDVSYILRATIIVSNEYRYPFGSRSQFAQRLIKSASEAPQFSIVRIWYRHFCQLLPKIDDLELPTLEIHYISLDLMR
jgi:hypothetical protein